MHNESVLIYYGLVFHNQVDAKSAKKCDVIKIK